MRGGDTRRAEGEQHAPLGRPAPWLGVLVVLMTVSLAAVALSMAIPPLTGRPYDDYEGWLRKYLDVGRESNAPTWWSASLLVVAAMHYVLAALVAGLKSRAALPWLAVAVLLVAFSADEATLIHDRARHLTDLLAPGNTLHHAWLGVGIPLALLVLVVAVLVARSLPATARRLLLVGLGVFFTGAVGMELVHSLLGPRMELGVVWVAIYHLEELLEMWGVSLVLVAPLAVLRWSRVDGGLDLRLADRVPSAPR